MLAQGLVFFFISQEKMRHQQNWIAFTLDLGTFSLWCMHVALKMFLDSNFLPIFPDIMIFNFNLPYFEAHSLLD